ncbi:MAG: hypothetical protein LBQ33_00925 [Oscillospiraceae bacterium]|jgi:hypothetical protein|nr:hypothetical protein [Oscillospiraceae bacterium]
MGLLPRNGIPFTLHRRQLTAILALLVMLALSGVGGATLASFYQYSSGDARDPATERRVNIVTVGKVDVLLREPAWDAHTPEDVKLYPNREILKDPRVKNTGNTEAYLFLEVWIPVRTVRTVSGSNKAVVLPAAPCELFTFTAHSAWTELTAQARSETDGGEDYRVRVYAYKAVTAPGFETEPLFQSVKFLNMLEGEINMGAQIDMPLSTIAIQSEYLNESGGTIEQKLESAYTIYQAIPDKEDV